MWIWLIIVYILVWLYVDNMIFFKIDLVLYKFLWVICKVLFLKVICFFSVILVVWWFILIVIKCIWNVFIYINNINIII